MTIAESMLKEFEAQAPITRRFLERLPEEKLTWKPHEKSMTAGQLAFHLAWVPGAVVRLVQQNPAVPRGFNFPQPVSTREVLEAMEKSVGTVRSELPKLDDRSMEETWRLVQGDSVLVEQARGLFLRDVMLSHWYQHRGQFSVYLRLLGQAVPASWGPSADEPPQSMQKAKSA